MTDAADNVIKLDAHRVYAIEDYNIGIGFCRACGSQWMSVSHPAAGLTGLECPDCHLRTADMVVNDEVRAMLGLEP